MAPREPARQFWVFYEGEIHSIDARTPALAAGMIAGKNVAGILVFDSEPCLRAIGRCGRCKSVIDREDLHHIRNGEIRCEGCP